MTPKELVIGIYDSVVEENVASYRSLFSSTDASSVSDSYWIRALTFFSGLTESQRIDFFRILQQVIVDTTSNVLGIIDGISYVQGSDGTLELTHAGRRLNGDLQSLFLEVQERQFRTYEDSHHSEANSPTTLP